ncbi:probable nuclear export mediator factor Nemf [Coccomyxa sp. Obi]|nr:probable nuclear export mediator factor Nemf [Coccomyxa sp. Obi]
MVKQRMSTADVAGEVACLRQSVLGMRVANVYDVNSKTYIIKLSKSGEDGEKALLVLESGVRFHTTQYMKEKADTPSNFTLKLRKHLRTRRLDDVRQLGVDRVVDFSFGTGDACYHLILELYAQGNVILTDANYVILTLLRSHRDDDKGLAIMARHAYPVHAIRLRTALEPAQLDTALETADDKQTLRGALASVVPYGPALCEHCILLAGLRPTRKPKAEPLGAAERTALLAGVRQWEAWLDACETSAPEGFISFKRTGKTAKGGAQQLKEGSTPNGAEESAPGDDSMVYESFDPLILQQNAGQEVLSFPTYNAALDEFYAKVEGQKAAQARLQAEQAVLSKLDRIRIDQTSRADALEREAQEAEAKAHLIEMNAEAVDEAINAVRVALAQGLSWAELERLIRDEAAAGNRVAGRVHALHLDRNAITLVLPDWIAAADRDADRDADDDVGSADLDDDEEAAEAPTSLVEVDLDLNAQQNARAWHADRKARSAKQAKTIEANHKALAVADKKVQVQLSKVKAVAAVQQLRKPAWFEKFNWFVTSENYLVVSGRDAQQNELLVKRYLRKDDLYVHADLHGASTTIVRNHEPSLPVPPNSVSQAGAACVCRSQAWDAKIVTSAWWVYAHQVSKTAPSGEYLPTGSFMIRGRKNFLPPHPLIMGLTFLFKLDESCIAGHLGERAPKSVDDDDSMSQSLPDQDAGVPSIAAPSGANGTACAAAAAGEGANSGEDGEEEEDADGAVSEGTPSEQARDDVAEQSAEASTRASTSQLEAFLDAAADPLRARRTSSTQAGSNLTGRGNSGHTTELLDRYGLAASSADAEEDGPEQQGSTAADAGASSAASGGRRHLSAKERKLMKKGGLTAGEKVDKEEPKLETGADPEQDAQAAAVAAERERRAAKAQAAAEAAAASAAALARGKRGKAKKAKEKYAHQDEEDRQLALEFLAPAGEKKDKKEKKQARKAARNKGGGAGERNAAADRLPTPEELAAAGARLGPRAEAERKSREEATAAAAAEATVSEEAAVSSSSDDDEEAHEAELHQQLQGKDSAEAKEIAAILAEEKVELVPEEDKDKLHELDSFTGQPRPDDILLYALPMCAPYNALQSYKLKVKLTPGTQRKGRAGRQAIELLSRASDIAPRERDLLKAIPEMEVINAMVGNVKLAMPGLSKIKTEARRSKKKGG